MGVTLSPLRLRESPKNVGVEFGSEGAESKEVSGLPSEEAEVSEQLLEEVSGEGLECVRFLHFYQVSHLSQ